MTAVQPGPRREAGREVGQMKARCPDCNNTIGAWVGEVFLSRHAQRQYRLRYGLVEITCEHCGALVPVEVPVDGTPSAA
jgi:ribosomal protein S27E